MRLIKICFIAVSVTLIAGCLEEVSNVPREKEEALFIIVRNEGNSDEAVDFYVDSLLVGKTFKDKITEAVVPAGEHTLFFEYDHDHYGTTIDIAPNSVIAVRQYVLNAYMFHRVAFDSLNDDSLNFFLKQNLPVVKYNYYEATQKVNTWRFSHILADFEKCPIDIRTVHPRN
ncbi:MAG TPA: hypothetical protein VLX68_09500 [Chitinivibrionales bacterium]|nr:hypothetical protein [Chitinivibrionales bacterium]